MGSKILFFIKLAVSFLPFVLFAFFNGKANVKKTVRQRQYLMPLIALVYSIVLLIFMDYLADLFLQLFLKLADLFDMIKLGFLANAIRKLESLGVYLVLVVFNTAALLIYVILKRIITLILGKIKVHKDGFVGSVVSLFYNYDELNACWNIKAHYGQARSFIKTAYYGSCFVSGLALMVSANLCMDGLISAPFYPVFAVIVIGEMAFFIDGLGSHERKSTFSMEADRSRRIAMYPMLRKPLKALFGDKLSAEGTTVNNSGTNGGAIEDVLADLEQNGGHIGKNYALFLRKKMEAGLKPNVDYARCGYDLSVGKSLLFNTPFYDKLSPYIFYAMNRELLTGGKIMIVLGRHGTEKDLQQWSEKGMQTVSNIPGLWKIEVLSNKKTNEDSLPDIGIISCSGVHDLDIHKNNLSFLRKVSFVLVVEPSRLVTTAQIGLNLLIKCCGMERAITFCSVDRNCDGLVDALSHILMTNITEVSATEYPHGMSSYMYWTADDDYLQHRILPGVSRCLGMGTELSVVALKNQIKEAVWYGGEAFPVQDARWIAKQYYYDLLSYAQLPPNQETFDKRFKTSFNMCDERVSDYSFITVEDDRNNLFETRRNFATIAEQQGFVNVISSEYMLREYMSDNDRMLTADAKAIPYITADYARTKRNAILSLCLLLCIDSVKEAVLHRQMAMLNIEAEDPAEEVWKEICNIFGDGHADKKGTPSLVVRTRDGRTVRFEKDQTLLFKRAYSVESGQFESVYTIENADFSRIILDDLQNASYIAEQESKDVYIGTELKGHVYQKYMPGQFFTLNGKYYEMISTATDNRILVRRASDHIGGRLSYRQVRNYTIHKLEDSRNMGAQKSINNIGIHYMLADFSVETPGYWKLHAYNDFDNGDLVKVNGVPAREYHHKQLLKFDFSKLGDLFTDSVRMTLTNLLNEAFVTLFADNQPFISAVTPGSYEAPLTYSLTLDQQEEESQKCIYIIEDSQLDIGLLIAVERNIKRILQIVADYLNWNQEKIEESLRKEAEPEPEKVIEPFDVYADDGKPEKKKCFFRRLGAWFKNLFKRKKKKGAEGDDAPMTPKEKKKAEKAARKAEKEAAKAAKVAAKEAEKAAKEAAKAEKKNKKSQPEATVEENVPVQTTEEISVEESAEETAAEEAAEASAAEEVGEESAAEETTEEAFTEEVVEQIPAEETHEEIPLAEIAEESPAEEIAQETSAIQSADEIPMAELEEAPATEAETEKEGEVSEDA